MAIGTTVELRHATLPPPLGLLAVHCWLVLHDAGRSYRWEVWQSRNAGGISTGYVHCNLMPPDAGVGGGPSRLAAIWGANEAAAIAAVLRNVARYPHCDRYRAWPGPNSNTFVAWVLREAGVACSLNWRALGKNYRLAPRASDRTL